jgi:dihydrofolate synthase/folylpolyglutamate synthase
VSLVLGVLADKDHATMAQRLGPLADLVVCTRPSSPRALDPASLAADLKGLGARVRVEPDPVLALDQATRATPPDGLVLGAGSLYLVGALLASRQKP